MRGVTRRASSSARASTKRSWASSTPARSKRASGFAGSAVMASSMCASASAGLPILASAMPRLQRSTLLRLFSCGHTPKHSTSASLLHRYGVQFPNVCFFSVHDHSPGSLKSSTLLRPFNKPPHTLAQHASASHSAMQIVLPGFLKSPGKNFCLGRAPRRSLLHVYDVHLLILWFFGVPDRSCDSLTTGQMHAWKAAQAPQKWSPIGQICAEEQCAALVTARNRPWAKNTSMKA